MKGRTREESPLLAGRIGDRRHTGRRMVHPRKHGNRVEMLHQNEERSAVDHQRKPQDRPNDAYVYHRMSAMNILRFWRGPPSSISSRFPPINGKNLTKKNPVFGKKTDSHVLPMFFPCFSQVLPTSIRYSYSVQRCSGPLGMLHGVIQAIGRRTAPSSGG